MLSTLDHEKNTKPCPGGLTEFCEDVLSSLPRSDQRRWGRAYVHGLVAIEGRKSIRKIAEQVVGSDSQQCLQQFVNQSPWEWAPVRRRLAQRIQAGSRVEAWVFGEAVFPKNGPHSVGVDRQFVPAAGRVVNCQRAVVASLAVGSDLFPVGWRLVVPRTWDDEEARRRAGLPEEETHRPRSRYILEIIDEMIEEWGLPPAPVIVDGRHDTEVGRLVGELGDRGMTYAVQIHRDLPLAWPKDRGGDPLCAADLARMGRLRGRGTSVTLTAGGNHRQIVVVRLPVPAASATTAPARRLVAEWVGGRQRPTRLWLVNAPMTRLASMLELLSGGSGTVTALDHESGLQHFEGRSFRGWHHHVTLASLAHAFRHLDEEMSFSRALAG